MNNYENFLQIFIVSLLSSVSLVLHRVFTVGLDFKAGSVSGFFLLSLLRTCQFYSVYPRS